MSNYHSRQIIALQQKYEGVVSPDRVAYDYTWCRDKGVTLPLDASHTDRLPIEYIVDVVLRVENSPSNRLGRFVSSCIDILLPN